MKKSTPFGIFMLCIAAALVCLSCKKETAEETKPYMEGDLTFDFPTFVKRNSMVTTEASGIQKPAQVTYRWVGGSMFKDTITSRRITIVTPDTTGAFYITLYAMSDGYYASTSSKEFNTVQLERNTSLKGLALPGETFLDTRDNTEYDIVTIGSLQWFAQNLGWDRSGVAFEGSPVMNTLFGRLYSWNEATGGEAGQGLGGGPQGVCPQGWSVPTREDWEDLAAALGSSDPSFSGRWDTLGDKLSAKATFNGGDIWPYSYNNSHSNTARWNAIPVGCYSSGQMQYSKYGNYAFFWSSAAEGDMAYYRYIYRDEDAMPSASIGKDGWYASLRCVRLAQ